MILRFIWSLLTRFAKTVGCLLFIAGLCTAGRFYQERKPTIEAARYHQSRLLTERLAILQSTYASAQQTVMKLKGVTDFPAGYTAAAFKPQFPASFTTPKDFQDLRMQLSQTSAGMHEMKRYLTDHIENLLADIEKKLLAHAASLASPPANNATKRTAAPDFGVYEREINPADVSARRSTLEDAKQVLGVLQESAEAPENKQKLADSISEIDTLENLLPLYFEPPAPQRTIPAPEVNAAKVAARVQEVRSNIRRALLSSWALDQILDQATHTATEEQQRFLASGLQVEKVSQELYSLMALAVTAGMVLGLFFLLIGDWTQKASTIVHSHWCQLINGITATPSEVYDIIEEHVKKIQVPELEISRPAWHEGGALSAKRQYLRFARERLVFDICAAPFGTGFFLSFRCSEIPLVIDPLAIFAVLAVTGGALVLLVAAFGLMWGGIILVFGLSLFIFLMRSAVLRGLGNIDRVLMKTPLVAPLYEIFLRPVTYYRIDSTAMYLQAVQGATSEAFQSIFGDHAPNLLPGTVSQPVLDEIYRKRFQ